MQNVIFTESRRETRKPHRSIVCLFRWRLFREVSLDETYFYEMEFMASVRSPFIQRIVHLVIKNELEIEYVHPPAFRMITSIKRFLYEIIDRERWWIISYNLALRVSIWPRIFRYHIICKCNHFSYRLERVNDVKSVNRWRLCNLLWANDIFSSNEEKFSLSELLL